MTTSNPRLELLADPVDSVRRAWLPYTYAIAAHLETCAACRDGHACSTGLRLREDEERAFQALERARESQL